MLAKLRFSIIFVIFLSLSSAGYSEPGTIMLDFDKAGDVNTEPGFTSFLMSDSGAEVNGITIDLAGDINDVRRATPNDDEGVPIYTEQVYRDFIYGKSPSGVTILLSGLGVNQECDITIYAFDDNSTPARLADWTANGDYLLTTEFEGGDAFQWPSPWWYPSDDPYEDTGTATADKCGTILLTSTRNPASPEGEAFAFVNALVAAPTGTYIPPPYAQHPVPFEGAEDVLTDVNLMWKVGEYADTHDVYLGTDFNDVNDANRSNHLGVLASQNQPAATYDPTLDFNTTYYWRIDEVNDPNIWKGKVWSFTTYMPVLIAGNPEPLDGAQGVLTDVTLSWEEGEDVKKHDVYLGTDFNDVNDANRGNPLGVLVSQDYSATTYSPDLDFNTTYYWRIDEVNAPPYYTIFKGEVWNFRTCNAPPSRLLEPPYEVGTWQGFKQAAISYTFDDGTANQYSIAIPMFNEPNFGFKLTMFTVTNWGPNWTALQDAAAAGHEVGSHTVTHVDLSSIPISQQILELADSQSTINSYIPGEQCDTIAYPMCNPSDQATTAQYYIAARACSGYIESNTPSNFYQISSLGCGSSSGLNSPEAFYSTFASTAGSQGWCVLLIHAIDNEAGYSPLSSATLRASLEYLSAHRSTLWVQTFRNVVRYIRERNDVSVTELSNQGTTITLQVTDTLNNENYNYPVTLRRPLPEGWSTATVSQNSQPIDVSFVVIGSTEYIMFDVVPDGGDVVLSKYYGDFTGEGIVDMNDLSVFRSYWLVDDCEETAGVDLNEDCLVNFYEYAFLAENWLLQVP